MKQSGTSHRSEVKQNAKNWQCRRQEDLAAAFYAYDTEEKQQERVVSFRLDHDKLAALKASVPFDEAFELVVYLGLRNKKASKTVRKKPDFVLYLEVLTKGSKPQRNCYELTWVKNGRFSTTFQDDTNSGKNAIPGASAYLFVQSWLQTPEAELALPFTAATRVLGTRVKSYRFSAAESVSIMADVETSLAATKGKKKDKAVAHLDIHLGSGMAVWAHPFSFRPVLEVKHGADPLATRAAVPFVSRLVNDSGDSFYDYSYPDPPGFPTYVEVL